MTTRDMDDLDNPDISRPLILLYLLFPFLKRIYYSRRCNRPLVAIKLRTSLGRKWGFRKRVPYLSRSISISDLVYFCLQSVYSLNRLDDSQCTFSISALDLPSSDCEYSSLASSLSFSAQALSSRTCE